MPRSRPSVRRSRSSGPNIRSCSRAGRIPEARLPRWPAIRTTFGAVSATLAKLDPAGAAQLDAAIAALATAIEAKAPVEDIEAGIDAIVVAIDGVLPTG